MALSTDKIVAIGGVIRGGGTTDALQIYDLKTNTWSQGAKLPQVMNHPNAGVVDGKLYLLGASPLVGCYGPPLQRQAFTIPQQTHGRRSKGLPKADARGASAMGVYNRTIYVAGGKMGTSTASVTTVSAFDVDTKDWIALTSGGR